MHTDTTARIVAYLEHWLDDFLAQLSALVGMDSYSFDRDDVNRVVDWLDDRLRAIGFAVTRYPHKQYGDDLLAVRQGKGTGRVMLLGHSDTVFPHGTAAARPMTAREDKILGPGTCDMKGGLLAGIFAVEALDAIGYDAYEQVVFLVVSEEEADDRRAVSLIRRASREVDAVLVLEAARANGDIVTARKGIRAFGVEARGRAAHAGVEPEKGCNAILALAHQVIALEALNDRANGISVNAGFIEGGRLRNVVPDHARVSFEMRAYNRADLDRVTAAILSLFAREPVPGVTFTVDYMETSPPMPRTAEIARLEFLARQMANALGFEVQGASTGGAGDAAFAADEGVPVLDGLGPVGGLDHSPDEYILKSSIVPRTALLAKMIMVLSMNDGGQ